MSSWSRAERLSAGSTTPRAVIVAERNDTPAWVTPSVCARPSAAIENDKRGEIAQERLMASALSWFRAERHGRRPNLASIGFCRGIWADGSGFNNVIQPPQAEGQQVIAPSMASTPTKATSVGAVWCEGVRRRKSNGPSGSLI